jgi:GxxExxY protein
VAFQRQVPLAIAYGEVLMDCGYIADLIVESQVILELKSVEHLLPVHKAQLLTYLRSSSCRIGLLINFNTVSLTGGIRRCVL